MLITLTGMRFNVCFYRTDSKQISRNYWNGDLMRRETDEIPLADVDYRIPGVYSDEDLLSRNLIRRGL